MEYIKTFEEFINESQLNEAKTIIYKRQYTDKHPALEAGLYGKVRDKILEALKDGKMTQEEFDGIVKEFNLSPRWLRNNAHLFKSKDGSVSLSETGQRILRAKGRVVNEENDNLDEASSYKIDDVIKFKDGEEWIVCKPGLRGPGERLKSDELYIKPYNKLAKERNVSLGIDVSLDYINKNKA